MLYTEHENSTQGQQNFRGFTSSHIIKVFFRRNNNALSLHLHYAVKYPVFSLFRPNVLPLCLLGWTDCKPNKP